MGILGFLFRLVLRLFLWASGIAVALALFGYFVFRPAVDRAYPDFNEAFRAADFVAGGLGQFYSIERINCEVQLSRINQISAIGAASQHFAIASLNHQQVCGQIEGSDPQTGLLVQERAAWFPGFHDRSLFYLQQVIRTSGITGNRRFWREHYRFDHCRQYLHNLFDLNGWAEFQTGNSTFASIRQGQFNLAHECSQSLYELGFTNIDADSDSIRHHALENIIVAERFDNEDAEWWLERVLPTLDQEDYGFFVSDGEDPSFETPPGYIPSPECEAAPFPELGFQDLRHFVARGHGEATDEWMLAGPPDRADTLWYECFADAHGAEAREMDRWHGGYVTPFWYAVHAIRSQHEMGLSHLDEIEADIGGECMALAREIGEGLAAILPGPPVNDPELRALVLNSITCQPEGLRDPTAYQIDDYSVDAEGEYLPPEAYYALPSFEPFFQIVEASE